MAVCGEFLCVGALFSSGSELGWIMDWIHFFFPFYEAGEALIWAL